MFELFRISDGPGCRRPTRPACERRLTSFSCGSSPVLVPDPYAVVCSASEIVCRFPRPPACPTRSNRILFGSFTRHGVLNNFNEDLRPAGHPLSSPYQRTQIRQRVNLDDYFFHGQRRWGLGKVPVIAMVEPSDRGKNYHCERVIINYQHSSITTFSRFGDAAWFEIAIPGIPLPWSPISCCTSIFLDSSRFLHATGFTTRRPEIEGRNTAEVRRHGVIWGYALVPSLGLAW
ncbi:hypothetical protein DFH07DRAFT_153089 [Mycena maculata]|uniref:Uncharacterized protein n=1 Tax=Mycena maculata TaxID=230809 RepID=A0AAD7I0A7_9AGAR|nr:hypothetical protein DFH07DRAFT_153089 [Mycena maculata]